jgi:hypothetical protein
MTITSKRKNYFIGAAVGAAILAGLLGYQAGVSSGKAEGEKAGFAAGFSDGDKSGWERAVEATTLVAYWAGAIDACNTVFDATGWEYIYVNPMAGGGTINREYFCRDNGNYEGTPVFDVPYVSNTEGSN